MKALHLIPQRSGGGSQFGWSFVKSFDNCETLFWNEHLRHYPANNPHPGVGIQTKYTGAALLTGSLLHSGLEQYYYSGWGDREDTGQYDLDAAIEGVDAENIHRQDEWENEDQMNDALALSYTIMQEYHETYGPGSPQCEFPRWRVASSSSVTGGDAEKDEPLIEYEFALDLGYRDYVFTSKLDLVLEDTVSRKFWVREHKSSAASRVRALINRCSLDGQISGESLCLHSAFPDQVGGVEVNIMVKNPGKGQPRFRREPFQRSDVQLEKFKLDVVRKLKRIDEAADYYRDLLQKGMSEDEAARVAFDGTPDGQRCADIFRCAFFDLCSNRSISDSIVQQAYRPRVYDRTGSNPFLRRE